MSTSLAEFFLAAIHAPLDFRQTR